jgi:hypothetical protein
MIIEKTSRRIALAIVFFGSIVLADEQAELNSLLNDNTYPISLEGLSLSGPGAELIQGLSQGTQFVALGEEHYNFHIPGIATAIFKDLQERHGYRYFMVEQDPVMMEMFSRRPARGDLDAINTLARTYPMGVTFNSDQELKMLADIGRISTVGSDVIWGCDQSSGVTHALDELFQEISDEKAIAAVKAFRGRSAEKEAVRDFSKGNFIYDTNVDEYVELKKQVNPAAGSRAEWILDVLQNASQVFDYYENGKQNRLPGYYENNRFREEHLKDLCLAKYRKAEKEDPLPKAMMKFGTWHIFEGLSPTSMHTIGDFFSNVARFNGQKFLSIHFVSRPENPDESMDQYGYIWPFIRDLKEDEFAVIDLRPFRRYPNRVLIENTEGEEWRAAYKESYARLVYGYDLIFYVGAHKPATFENE